MHIYVPEKEFWEVQEIMIKRTVGLIYEWKKLVIYSLSQDGHIYKGETGVSVHIFKEYSDKENSCLGWLGDCFWNDRKKKNNLV